MALDAGGRFTGGTVLDDGRSAQMKGHGEKLTRKQELAVAALLTCRTVPEAAEAAKVSAVTLYRWQQLPAFKAQLREARRSVLDQAILLLQTVTTEAVEALRSVMNDRKADARARVAASRAVLELSLKVQQAEEFDSRLAALESAAAEAGES